MILPEETMLSLSTDKECSQEIDSDYESLTKNVVLELYAIGAIKFGSFQLKNGSFSPYYIDLRLSLSKPKLLKDMCKLMSQKLSGTLFDSLCGVPYAALALCTGIAQELEKPMLMVRKEKKMYGTGQLIEGIFKPDDQVMIIEDVITSGSSIKESAKTLREAHLLVKGAVVFIDREQDKDLEAIEIHSVLTITKIFNILKEAGHIIDRPLIQIHEEHKKCLSYAERIALAKHPVAKKLFSLMEEKKSNLAIALDKARTADILEIADKVGPHICLLKTHVDIIEDFDFEFLAALRELAKKHQFLLFEDRKFADIGNTALMQYEGGLYKISSWADIINAHALVGEELIKALKKAGAALNRGLLLIPELSSKGALTDDLYAKKTVEMGLLHEDFVFGFIARKKLTSHEGLITMTPGVSLCDGKDNFGQQYLTPFDAIAKARSDIIIVGRGLYQADDPATAAKIYQESGWSAYLHRLNQGF